MPLDFSATTPVRRGDVRTEAEYKAGSVEGAIVIPFNEVKARAVSELGKDEEVIFHCHNGPIGAQAASILVEMGYSNVSNVRGGIAAWQVAGNPLVQ
ncbi:MAG: rhodanese-like domain-containing protein [Chloroflexi bacterium]|nr:rhodanese-like domain-containing protein [Chloroflexota bacterium]